MAHVVMVSDSTQALAIPHHPDRFSLLMCGQLGLRPEFHTSFFLRSPPPFARARMRPLSSSARAERKARMPLPNGADEIEPLPIERLEGCSSCCDTLDDPDAVQTSIALRGPTPRAPARRLSPGPRLPFRAAVASSPRDRTTSAKYSRAALCLEQSKLPVETSMSCGTRR